jgi:hypothetical protein
MVKNTLIEAMQAGYRSPVLPPWRRLVAKLWWVVIPVVLISFALELGGYVVLLALILCAAIGAYDFITARLRP